MNEIPHDHLTGSTLYATRFQPDGNVFVTDGSSDEAWTDADLYDVTMTEDGVGGHYVGDFDTSGNITEGVYQVAVFLQEGGSPANSDFVIARGQISWDGTAEINGFTLDTSLTILSAQGSRVLNKYPTEVQQDV
jgi:hypothetical protein